MEQFFSNKTEEAIQLIYMGYSGEGFTKAAQLLTEAASEGDADALYFLHRCLLGKEFIWEYSNFEYNMDKSMELLKRSVLQGSCLGIMGALRLGKLEEFNPEADPKKAFDTVLKMAEAGQPFCQYVIGNAYFWEDIYEIENLPHPLFNPKAYNALGMTENNRIKKFQEIDYEMTEKAIEWFQKSTQAGYIWCAKNLLDIYRNGRGGFPSDQQKYENLLKTCAATGNPLFEYYLANFLHDQKKYNEAFVYYESALQKGHLDAWYDLGEMYDNGKGVSQDKSLALTYYQKAADAGHTVSMGIIGRVYLYGELNAETDYARAFYYLNLAAKEEDANAYDLLGLCFLKGYGTDVDYKRAKYMFENGKQTNVALNGLGQIYTDGLGVPEDIAKGISYFMQAGDDEAKSHIARFKKSLFGKWTRR